MSQKSSMVALRASLFYGLVAGLWILFSDQLLAEFVKDRAQYTKLETYKGWFFVGFTGVMLFLIMRQLLERESKKIKELKKADSLTRLQQEALQMIASGKPLPDTLEVLLRGIEAQSPGMLASILLLDGTHLRHGAAPSLPKEYTLAIDGATIGPRVGSCGTAAHRGSPVFVSDIAHDPLWADYKHLALPHGLRSCWSTPILDEQKKVLGTFGIYHRKTGLPSDDDVGVIELVTHTATTAIEKHRAEKSLRESEERFRMLVEHASDAIFVHDTNGKILDVNRSACETLGFSRKELLQMSVMEITAEVQFSEVLGIWQKLKVGDSQIVRGLHQRKNGTTFPVEVSLTSYELSGQRVIAALARNLSGRKEYEDQLAQSVSLLRATIESSANGLLVVGLHGKVTLYNNRFAEMWRIPAELMVQGENAALLKAVFDQLIEPASFNQRVEEISQHPESESFDTIKFKDGRVFERVTRPQRLGDKIIGRVWSYRDVTEQKRTHEALERERELLRLMEANTSDRIYFKDLESRFIRVNETMAKLHGCENPADIIGKTDFDVFGKEHAGEAFVDEQRIIQTGIPMIGYEEKELWSNGKITWVSSSKACLRDSEGHIIGTFGISRDITKQKEIELALRENEERMRTLFDLSPDAIMVEDLNGRVLDVNDAACQLHEMTKEELIGKSVYELAPTDTHPTVKIDFAKLVSGQTRNIEGESLTAKGRRIPVDINASRITYVGQPALLINVRDISERRHATEMLRTTQALYSSLVEQMPVCVFRKDAAGRFEFANSRFCELKQLKREEILGRTAAEMAEYKLGQNLSDANDYNFSVVGVNHHNTIMKTGKTIEVDEEYIAPDGEVRFFHVFKTPVFDSNRKIIGSQGIMFDLTDRKQIDEKLRLANERTKFYMSRLPLAFIAWDQDFCVTEWNPAAERMFGWTTAEAIGRHAYELIVPADTQPLVSKVWQEIIAGGNLASHSVNDNVAKDGRRLNCEWRNMPLRDAHSRICGCLSIVEDITERVRNEKQRNELESQLRQSHKMEAVGQLSGGIAHDFNNILTIIQGNAALLQNLDLQPEEIHDASNQISNAAERAAGLTRQLLLFARKQEMQLINLDLNETVAHITKMLQRILGEDLALRTEYASALPLIQADTGMIEQILLNLAVNARDAMSNGGKLTIRTFSEKRSGKTESAVELWVGLQFTDNGSGIAPEILPRIFEPFFTTKKVGKGTGLGLATVYGIVQQHHGTINVQSEPGKGTTFTIAFPAAPVTETSQNLHKPQPTLPWGTETILLVEDEIPLRTFVSDLLQRCGYTVLEADSGPAALKIWATNRDKINLLFTDVIMPENMNGIELGQRLLAEKPALKIIYTSGYTGNLESRRATLVEGTNFIRKPFKPDGIANIIRYRLDEKSPAK